MVTHLIRGYIYVVVLVYSDNNYWYIDCTSERRRNRSVTKSLRRRIDTEVAGMALDKNT